MRHSVLWGNWQESSSESQILSGEDFRIPILVSPPSQKNTKIFHGEVCSSRLAVTFTRLTETFCKKYMCQIACTPPSPKSHIYGPSPCLFGAVSQSSLKCCLLGYSPRFAQIKFNLQLSRCAFFLSRHQFIFFCVRTTLLIQLYIYNQ